MDGDFNEKYIRFTEHIARSPDTHTAHARVSPHDLETSSHELVPYE